MMKKPIIILILIMLTLSVKSQCRKYNKVDEKGLKQGWWISYWDDEKKIVCMKNYYVDGRETKMCKNYHSNGNKWAKFNYHKNRIRVKYYNEEGRIMEKGWAKMDYTAKEIRFFLEGKWKSFDESRTKISETEYLDGHLISEKLFTK